MRQFNWVSKLLRRIRRADKRLSVRVKQGKYQVVHVVYNKCGYSSVTPCSPWRDIPQR
jgi:ribosomal protein L32